MEKPIKAYFQKKYILVNNLKEQSHYIVLHQRERMLIRSHTLIYVRVTLGIRRVRSKYADIRRCTLLYTQRPNYFLDMFNIFSASV